MAKLPSKRDLALGSPINDTLREQWTERGTIISVNPNTLSCVVETETRGRLTVAVPGLSQDPAGSGGEVQVPRLGQQVLVQSGLGAPTIIQMLPVAVAKSVDRSTAFSVGAAGAGSSGAGTTAAAFPTSGGISFLGRLPAGLLPGDWVKQGNQGQHLALLDGGVVSVQATPWARVVASREGDTLLIAGRNLQLHTGFGNLIFSDSGGKQSFTLQGGTDQKTETGVGAENWPYSFRAVAGGLELELRDRRGEQLYKNSVDAAGVVDQFARSNLSSMVMGNYLARVIHDRIQTVSGTDATNVGGIQTVSVGGNQETTVSQSQTTNVMQDVSLTINRDYTLSVGRQMNLSAGGNTLAKPGDAAVAWSVSNGSLVVDIGRPPMDLQKALSGMKVTTWGLQGDIAFTSMQGKVILNTTQPGSVLLGSTAGVAAFHGVLWEPLQAFLTQLVAWLTAHVHPSGMGPTGAAVVPSPASAQLSSLITPIGSLKVLLGG